MGRDFADNRFIPFEYYVKRARESRLARESMIDSEARRRTDFTDAVIVNECEHINLPDFADTVPAAPGFEVTQIEPETVDPRDVVSGEEAAAALLERARLVVAQEAFLLCLRDGYFPPRCQSCPR